MKNLIKKTAALIAVLLFLPACGYTLSKAGSNSAVAERGLYKVCVPTFVNDTYEPLIERDVTYALKDEIASDGRLVLTDGKDADLTVTGRVTAFDLQPLSYDASERILEYRVRIKAEIKLTDIKTGKVIWKDPDMETASDFRVIDDVTKSKIRKGEAIRKASKEMAEDFIIKALDIF